ncbi:5'-methylthioadenosine/adenosylhomocysteine nucleosidase [Paenibacillus septentrionalis]|uniref:adenosylhomocysteine nucleosidase n=1 Tax=Paenibacillus septentrionalis TaxID=429342 RepID=A0ABW1UXW5_9BACL
MTFTRIGIIGAMVEEIELLHQNVKDIKASQQAGVTYYEGKLHGVEVIYCKSGVGKVNAAICTQVLLSSYQVDCVLFTGVAGALDPGLNVGDIVISSSAMQHDMDVSPLGFSKGIIPFQEISDFPADSSLVELAKAAGQALFPGRTLVGRVVSGDQFIASVDKVKELHEHFGGVCAEMEGSAVAQVCTANGIPFVVIRSMSDKADGSAEVTYNEFVVTAANNSYAMIDHMISNL